MDTGGFGNCFCKKRRKVKIPHVNICLSDREDVREWKFWNNSMPLRDCQCWLVYVKIDAFMASCIFFIITL